MNVDDERLAKKLCRGRCLLAPDEEPVGVDVAVVDGDLPLLSPQVRGLRLSVSPQTGGCESDRDSALGEGCPRDEQKSGADCQDGNEAVNAGECKAHKILLTNSLGD